MAQGLDAVVLRRTKFPMNEQRQEDGTILYTDPKVVVQKSDGSS